MEITIVVTGEKKEVIIRPVEDEDYEFLTKKRYSFVWKRLKGEASLYKLSISGDEDILGVMALIDERGDSRIEIKLLASSKENVGPEKIHEGIAGCSIAYACRESVKKYAEKACVSLVPKTKLKVKYMNKYGMMDGGRQVYLEGRPLLDLIAKYLS